MSPKGVGRGRGGKRSCIFEAKNHHNGGYSKGIASPGVFTHQIEELGPDVDGHRKDQRFPSWPLDNHRPIARPSSDSTTILGLTVEIVAVGVGKSENRSTRLSLNSTGRIA